MNDEWTIEEWAEAWGRSVEDARALRRDGWICTAIVQPRKIVNGNRTLWFPKSPRRCSVTGSEMVVVDGQTLCPRHARERAENER